MPTAVKHCTFFAILSIFTLIFAINLNAANGVTRVVEVTLPESTAIHVTLNTAIASDRNQPGDRFEATLSQPVTLAGRTIIPAGARANGVVVDARRSGHLVGHAHLQLTLESIDVSGSTYEIHTVTDTRIGKRHGKHSLGFIGGGTGTGLLIGAIAAGGGGALVGGPIGAGVGTVAAVVTSKRDIRLPAETPVTFELASPATIDIAALDVAGLRQGAAHPSTVAVSATSAE